MNIQTVLEEIEISKDKARIRMDQTNSKTEQGYWNGIIGGLQWATQILEKEEKK